MKQKVVHEPHKKDLKENKVEVQRGPLQPQQKTMMFQTRQDKNIEDADNYALKRSGQTNHLHMPKK